MNIELAILKFANLLEVANISAEGGKGYERQEELIALCRENNLPFMAIMPMRHHYRCNICHIEQGESVYHLENPAVPNKNEENEIMWGPAKGLWAQIETAQLHQILAHGQKIDSQLLMVISSVYR